MAYEKIVILIKAPDSHEEASATDAENLLDFAQPKFSITRN
jgi:hypothetical protein